MVNADSTTCTTCTHPKHSGRRCMIPVTKEVSDPHGSLILTRTEVVGHCACGLVDEMAKNFTQEEFIQVLPKTSSDQRMHELGEWCWCAPIIDGQYLRHRTE